MKKYLSLLIIAILLMFPSLMAYCYDEANSMVKISGSYGASFAIRQGKFLWKEANGDYQEKNWRYTSNDYGVNTYDPRIFDRYQLEIETDTGTPWNAYTEIKVDPWSFTGIGEETIKNAWGDRVTAKYKYWEATGKVINENFWTYAGNAVGYPELKVIQGKVTHHSASPSLWGSPPFDFSLNRSVEIDNFFRPVRKLWVEYNEDPIYIKVFPIADQAEALTSDDPLKLSNNHVYWAPSPWIFEFNPGMILDPWAGWTSSTRLWPTRWDWDIAWFAEDSNRNYLNYLRGVSAGYNIEGFAEFNITAAAPMSPWDYYGDVDNIPVAARLKIYPAEKLTVGSTVTLRFGIDKEDLRAANEVVGVDFNYNVWDETDIFGEYAISFEEFKYADKAITKLWDKAAKVGVKSKLKFNESNKLEWDLACTSMGRDFACSLADYRDTRIDRDWGRHIWFDPLSDEDQAIRIGDSVDINRTVLGVNAYGSFMDEFLNLYFNFRNAHKSEDGKFIENIIRAEATCNPISNVQIKGLALHRKYPDSVGAFDPILRDRYTDDFLKNYHMTDGMKVEIMTFSGGAKVDLIDGKLSIYGIYEATNDPQDFPRGILNSIDYNTIVIEHNVAINKLITQVHNQNLFDLPPYDFYNIWKGVVTVSPVDNFSIKYTHVTNGNRNYAALIDNNHNQNSIEIGYRPFENVTVKSGYSLSRIIDLRRAVDTSGADRKFEAHHNIYAQINWDIKKDQRLTFQFGEAWIQEEDPGVFGSKWLSTKVSVLDTRKIFRISYQGKF